MLCGSDAAMPTDTVEWRGASMKFVLCCDCGLKYMRPCPSEAWYKEYYGHDFWEEKIEQQHWHARDRLPFLRRLGDRGLRHRLKRQQKRFATLEGLIAGHVELAPGAKVLDIGCAFGVIVGSLVRKHGCVGYGIEPNKTARAHAREEYAIAFVGEAAEDLIGLEGYDETFDLIIISNVLENIVRPRDILAACAQRLKKAGSVMVHTPNFYYYNAINPFHPYIFSAATLSELMRQAGLSVEAEICTPPQGVRSEPISLQPFRGERFVTLFGKPAEPVNSTPWEVDTNALIAAQTESIGALKKARRAYKRSPSGIIEKLFHA